MSTTKVESLQNLYHDYLNDFFSLIFHNSHRTVMYKSSDSES